MKELPIDKLIRFLPTKLEVPGTKRLDEKRIFYAIDNVQDFENKNVVVIGTQWGDEGKGKIVDLLTDRAAAVARFQGGPNAGHTLEFNNIKHITHNIPSGVFREGSINIIGNGVVLDPIIFKQEVDEVKALGVELGSRLKISRKAHLILPSHRLIDAASEKNVKLYEKFGF